MTRLLLLVAVALDMGCGRHTPTVPNCPPRLSPPRVAAPLGPAPCPSAAELSAIDVPISFEGDGSGGTLVCRDADGSWDLTQVQKNAYRALLFMKTVEFEAPLPWTNLNLYQWFRGAVSGIRVRTDIPTNGCCSPAGVINLLGTIVEENSLSSGFLEMMVHEARHAEGRPHTCGTNDRTVDEMGGYGVQYSVMLWIGSHWPQATQAEKDFALNRVTLLRASGVFCEECE